MIKLQQGLWTYAFHRINAISCPHKNRPSIRETRKCSETICKYVSKDHDVKLLALHSRARARKLLHTEHGLSFALGSNGAASVFMFANGEWAVHVRRMRAKSSAQPTVDSTYTPCILSANTNTCCGQPRNVVSVDS